VTESYPIDFQLNVDGPPDRLADVAVQWVDHLLTSLVGPASVKLAGLPADLRKARALVGDGDVLGTVGVLRLTDQGPVRQERTLSTAGIDWLRQEMLTPPAHGRDQRRRTQRVRRATAPILQCSDRPA
jgi:hypothetical protein